MADSLLISTVLFGNHPASCISKSESHTTNHLQPIRNETNACKRPINDHSDLLLITRTSVIDLSSTTTMFAIV